MKSTRPVPAALVSKDSSLLMETCQLDYSCITEKAGGRDSKEGNN